MIDAVRKRGRARTAFKLVLVVMLLALSPPAVLAHAKLIRSQPKANARLEEAPKLIELWFSEELEPNFSTIEVTDAEGKRIALGEVTLSEGGKKVSAPFGDLSPGVYTVAWKALSKDEHTIRGKFTFTLLATAKKSSETQLSPGERPVETPPERPSENTSMEDQQAEDSPLNWSDSLVRWLSYLAMMSLFGGFAFRLFVIGPVLRGAGEGEGDNNKKGLAFTNRRALLIFWMSLGLLLLTSVVALVFQASAVFGTPLSEAISPALWRGVLMRTGYGSSWLLQASATVLLVLVVIILSWRINLEPSEKHTAWWWVGVAASALLLLSPSWTGHAAASAKDYRLAIVTDWLHLIGGGFWVGGLLHIALSGLPALRYVERGERTQLIGQLISKFTRVAVPSVALLTLAGLYNTWIHVGSLQGLWVTSYGRTLLLKSALVLLMLLLGGANNFYFGRKSARLSAVGAGESGTETKRLEGGFKRSVAVEAGIGVLVLLVTAALVFITPARNHPVMTQTEQSPPVVVPNR